MKKLLVATSALVAAGSAATLEVTLGGEISTSVSFDGAVWAGPAIGGGADDGISLAVSGESMGWTYGAEMDLLAGDLTGATVTLKLYRLGCTGVYTNNSVEWIWHERCCSPPAPRRSPLIWKLLLGLVALAGRRLTRP